MSLPIRPILPLLFFSFATLVPAAPPRVLAWDEGVAGRKLALVIGENAVPIERMHPFKRTSGIRVRGKGPLLIRALDKPAGPEGKPVERACPVPENLEFPLIVIMPDKKDPTGVNPMVIDDNPAGFRWGCYRFLNSTSKDLLIRMENKVVRIPQGWKPVDVELGGESRGFGAMVALPEATEKPIYSAVWQYDKNARTLCFLVPGTDPRLSPLSFKAIPEDRRTLELEAKADQERERGLAPASTPEPEKKPGSDHT